MPFSKIWAWPAGHALRHAAAPYRDRAACRRGSGHWRGCGQRSGRIAGGTVGRGHDRAGIGHAEPRKYRPPGAQ